MARASLRPRAPRGDRDDALVETGRVGVDAEDLVALLQSIGFVVRVDQTGLRPAQDMSRWHTAAGVRQGNDAGRAELENLPIVVGVGDLVPVRESTSESGAFSAMTRPSWLGRAARNRHRHAIEQNAP